jgi:hypothetical protein
VASFFVWPSAGVSKLERIKIGWTEWDLTDGIVWADDKRLPAWKVDPAYSKPSDPNDPQNPFKREANYGDPRMEKNPSCIAEFKLENGLFVTLLAQIEENGYWSVAMLLHSSSVYRHQFYVDEFGETQAVESWLRFVDKEKTTVTPITHSWSCGICEDPEDYDEVRKLLKEWSSLTLLEKAHV